LKIIWNGNLCYGCKACQLACSFHHTNSFYPEKSSITVFRSSLEGTIKWSINSTCDECQSETEPLCIKYCTYKALQVST